MFLLLNYFFHFAHYLVFSNELMQIQYFPHCFLFIIRVPSSLNPYTSPRSGTLLVVSHCTTSLSVRRCNGLIVTLYHTLDPLVQGRNLLSYFFLDFIIKSIFVVFEALLKFSNFVVFFLYSLFIIVSYFLSQQFLH